MIYVPISAAAGFVLHRAVLRSRARDGQTPKPPPQWSAIVLPLFCLIAWIALCYAFKLLTWKPYAGDAPGSVGLTSTLMLVGSALVGAWTSARLRQSPVTPRL